jgi:acyl-CoA synthetase (AMP-forming)/AMP-acid ligase II
MKSVTNLATNLRDAAGQYPERDAVRLDVTVLTYADVDDRTARVAGWLRGRGMQAGDRVGIMLPNVLAFPLLYYGTLRVGGVVVPMNPLLKAREVQHCLGDSEATPEQLCGYVKERVAAYKYPRQVWLAEALPKGPTGKILKREIVRPALNG